MISILKKIVDQKWKDIESSKAAVSLEQLQKDLEQAPAPRDFLAALTSNAGVSLIAEVKRASPSKGLIREDFEAVKIATEYEANGASCISVLTDEHFFQGHLDYLRSVRSAVQIPVLRKDFILDPYQVFEARVAGADAVLLIAECLNETTLCQLHDQIVELGMTPLVELYEEENLQAVLKSGAKLIGVNNRDLRTFEVDLNHTVRMKEKLPKDRTIVGESGIFTAEDVALLAGAGVDAMLVGESLMRAPDIGQAVRDLLSQ